jgi:hypothetical protein
MRVSCTFLVLQEPYWLHMVVQILLSTWAILPTYQHITSMNIRLIFDGLACCCAASAAPRGAGMAEAVAGAGAMAQTTALPSSAGSPSQGTRLCTVKRMTCTTARWTTPIKTCLNASWGYSNRRIPASSRRSAAQ